MSCTHRCTIAVLLAALAVGGQARAAGQIASRYTVTSARAQVAAPAAATRFQIRQASAKLQGAAPDAPRYAIRTYAEAAGAAAEGCAASPPNTILEDGFEDPPLVLQ